MLGDLFRQYKNVKQSRAEMEPRFPSHGQQFCLDRVCGVVTWHPVRASDSQPRGRWFQLWLVSLIRSSARSGSPNSNPLCVRASGSFQLYLDLWQHAATLFGSPVVLVLSLPPEQPLRVKFDGLRTTSSFHLNSSSCRISCFLYVRAFLASINLCCASEFGLHWRNRIVVTRRRYRRTSKRVEREREREWLFRRRSRRFYFSEQLKAEKVVSDTCVRNLRLS